MFVVANVGVGNWRCDGGLLYQSIEQHSTGTRRAAVKAEGELAEIIVKGQRDKASKGQRGRYPLCLKGQRGRYPLCFVIKG